MNHRTAPTLACLALALAGSTVAHAQAPGAYFGIGAGSSEYADDLRHQIFDAYAGDTTYAVESARLSDKSGSAFKLTAGYRFTPWFSGELAYTTFGDAHSDFVLNSIVPLTTGSATIQGKYKLHGISAVAVGEIPLGADFSASLRAGLVFSRLEYSERGITATDTPHRFEADDEDKTRPVAGLGLAWNIDPQWSMRLDWDRWFRIGNRFALTEGGNGRFDHADAYTLNLIWRMPR